MINNAVVVLLKLLELKGKSKLISGWPSPAKQASKQPTGTYYNPLHRIESGWLRGGGSPP